VSVNVADLIRDLTASKSITPSELYAIWRARSPEAWKQTPEIYLVVGHRALEQGDAVFAFDVIAEGLESQPDDTSMQTLKGLALARCGATEQANAMLDAMYAKGCRDDETIGILARTHKDLGLNAVRPDAKRFHLERCAALYAEAYAMHKGYWTGINAATFTLLNGHKAQARLWAEEVREICVGELERPGRDRVGEYWLFATLGESALVREDVEEARGWYRKAAALKKNGYGSLASTRRNAALLLSEIGGPAGFLDECLPLPKVVAFTGHMVDGAGRKTSRFPPGREQAVSNEIEAWITQAGAMIGFASAACGADILFLEAALKAGGEVNIVLPSAPEAFIKTSVAPAGGNWVERFNAIVERANQLVILSEHHTGNTSYSYANLVLYGLAKSYAKRIDASLDALAVWDGETGNAGGTASAVQKWRNCGQAVTAINPMTLAVNRLVPASPLAGETEILSPQPDSNTGFPAELVSLLFADVVGFSKFTEEQIPAFVTHVLGAIGKLLDKGKYAPLMCNTWGDGLYFVFRDARSAGLVGLEICRMISHTDWSGLGFPHGISIRIGLHSGPALRLTNPITGRLDFHGTHVSRAARIEPITPPGEVFASQAFAAICEATGIKEFFCDYVGQTAMAKNYGVFPAYRLRPAQ